MSPNWEVWRRFFLSLKLFAKSRKFLVGLFKDAFCLFDYFLSHTAIHLFLTEIIIIKIS